MAQFKFAGTMFKKLFKKLPKMSSTPDFEKKTIFVYGTLKKNEPNHHVLCTGHGTSTFIGEGRTKQKYPLIIGTKYNIPFLLYSPGNGHQVKGEVYEVDYIMMGKLDVLEDHPHFYTREEDEIEMFIGNSHKSITCWVYFIKKFREELLSKTSYENYSAYGDHGLVYQPSFQSVLTIKNRRSPTYGRQERRAISVQRSSDVESDNNSDFETPVVTVKESEGLLTWRPVREKENEINRDLQVDSTPNTYLSLTPIWKCVTETHDTETSAIDSYGEPTKCMFRPTFAPLWRPVTKSENTEVEESSLADLDDDVAVTGPKDK